LLHSTSSGSPSPIIAIICNVHLYVSFAPVGYFLEKWIPGDGAAMVETLIVLLIVGGWIRALFVAASGAFDKSFNIVTAA
jgi:hypothetical protein